MKFYYDIDQNSQEWYDIRKLKFTASNASTIMAMGKGLETLINEMLADYYSSGEYEEYSGKYTNPNIERGHEFEDKARCIYALETDQEVEQVGFVEVSEHLGCSPDGLVGEDGLIEIKNHNDVVFLRLLETKKIEKKYLDQMQFQLFVTGRKWVDYFAFNPNFEPCYYKLRVYPEPEKQARIAEAVEYGTKMLLQKKERLDGILIANGKE